MEGRTNVVFVLTDDQGVWAAGCYGNPEIRTPNIDRLAQSGIRFTDFFCASPVCSPAWASLLTGRIPSQHGIHDWLRAGNIAVHALPAGLEPGSAEAIEYLRGEQSYTDVMAAAGYTCGLSGKWHCGDSQRPQKGFTHWFAHSQQGASYYTDAPMVRDGRLVQTQGYFSEVITDDALEFITANAGHPFYLSLHFTAPHAPWDCHPREVVESYDDCPFESCPQEPRHPWARRHTTEHLGNRESLKGYFAAVTAMDDNVGRLLDRLETLGLRDKTLIIFTSDNGHSCGHHGFWGKGNGTFPLNMYENSVKVPFVASHPGRIPAGRVNDRLLSAYDVFPTLLDYLGLPIPESGNRPGRSFAPLLRGESKEVRDSVVVYSEYGPVRMIRTQEWKYVHRYPFGPGELYDLGRDPDERRNVLDEPKNRALVCELQKQLNNWFLEYADPVTDGSRLPVTGRGQITAVDREHSPGEAFAVLDDLA